MCTVTYLPLPEGNYILTSSRDENPLRPDAIKPVFEMSEEQLLLFPRDGLHKGTWIAASDHHRTLCLLNGGLVKHEPKGPYSKSRGLVLLDAFQYDNCQDFALRYNLEGIEPFTLIWVDRDSLAELRWTGERTLLKKLNARHPFIWSSVTLYTPHEAELRKNWFLQWLSENQVFTPESILNFHLTGGDGDVSVNIRMKRETGVETVSITTVCHQQEFTELRYQNLRSGNAYREYLKNRTVGVN